MNRTCRSRPPPFKQLSFAPQVPVDIFTDRFRAPFAFAAPDGSGFIVQGHKIDFLVLGLPAADGREIHDPLFQKVEAELPADILVYQRKMLLEELNVPVDARPVMRSVVKVYLNIPLPRWVWVKER